jgi:hypothetical protein
MSNNDRATTLRQLAALLGASGVGLGVSRLLCVFRITVLCSIHPPDTRCHFVPHDVFCRCLRRARTEGDSWEEGRGGRQLEDRRDVSADARRGVALALRDRQEGPAGSSVAVVVVGGQGDGLGHGHVLGEHILPLLGHRSQEGAWADHADWRPATDFRLGHGRHGKYITSTFLGPISKQRKYMGLYIVEGGKQVEGGAAFARFRAFLWSRIF